MRTRLLGRLRTDPTKDPGSGPLEFEFAHLLDAVSRVEVDAVPDVEPEVEHEVVPDIEPEVEQEIVPDVEPEVVPDVEPEVAVSRFADAGLDDDRLPVTVKRRRGRRR